MILKQIKDHRTFNTRRLFLYMARSYGTSSSLIFTAFLKVLCCRYIHGYLVSCTCGDDNTKKITRTREWIRRVSVINQSSSLCLYIGLVIISVLFMGQGAILMQPLLFWAQRKTTSCRYFCCLAVNCLSSVLCLCSRMLLR